MAFLLDRILILRRLTWSFFCLHVIVTNGSVLQNTLVVRRDILVILVLIVGWLGRGVQQVIDLEDVVAHAIYCSRLVFGCARSLLTLFLLVRVPLSGCFLLD